ncbi:MAG: M48 family metalloprotease [Terracidiphilus sp.]
MPTAAAQPWPATSVQPPPPGSPQPMPGGAPPPQAGAPNAAPCDVCGGNGSRLAPTELVCPKCAWLRPLVPGYTLDRSVFLYAQDGQAMNHLQSISALHAAVRSVSDKVGRPWIESTFNGIRLGPRQFPDIWVRAVLAARLIGLPSMPDVYISGDSQWNTYTYGTEYSFFIVLGTAILNNFQNDDLLFVLAREMGHCRAGHALWKTVSRFLVGDTSTHGLLSNGVLNAISLSPTKWLQDAVDLPLMAWSRQADISADRAGLLAVGDEQLARRVLLSWSIKSARLLKQINIDEWLKQEEGSDDQMTRFSEMTTTASMYTTRRLRLLGQAAREPELMRWSQTIQPIRKQLAPPPQAVPGAPAAPPHPKPVPAAGAPPRGPAAPPAPADSIRVVCNKCQAAMRVPLAVLRGKTQLNVRCPQCHTVIVLRPKPAAPSPLPAPAATTAHPAVPPPASAGAGTKPVAPPSTGTGTTPSAPPSGPSIAKTKSAAPASAGAKPKSIASLPATAGAKK